MVADYMAKMSSMNNVPEIRIWKSSPKGVEKILGQDTSGVQWPRRVKVPSCVKKKYLLSIKRARVHIYIYIYIYIEREREKERKI